MRKALCQAVFGAVLLDRRYAAKMDGDGESAAIPAPPSNACRWM